MNQAAVSIKRPAKLAFATRKFSVFIDGRKVGSVKNGSVSRFEVSPGRHTLQVKVDFYRSKPCSVDLEPGQSLSLICGTQEGLSGFLSAFTSLEEYITLKPEQGQDHSASPRASAQESLARDGLTVHLDSEEQRIPAATEEVRVPSGVKIKVRRSRTVEHTVEVEWDLAGEVRLEAGFKQVISSSIRGEMSHRKGASATERETVEYEVEIDGQKGSQYQLQWTDVWRSGTVEFRLGGETCLTPFRYRDRSELEVWPLV